MPRGDRTLPWLYGVARRVLANQRRSRNRQDSLGRKLTESGPTEEQSPEVIVLRRAEDREMLDAATVVDTICAMVAAELAKFE